MATITREQINKMNAKLKNGFYVDIMQLLRGEKDCKKTFEMADGRTGHAHLYWTERMENGKKVNVPVVNFNFITKETDSFICMSGLGWTMRVGGAFARKSFNTLAKFTEELTDSYCDLCLQNLSVKSANPLA